MQPATIQAIGYALAGASIVAGVIKVQRLPVRPGSRITGGPRAYVLSLIGFAAGIGVANEAGKAVASMRPATSPAPVAAQLVRSSR